MASHPRTQGTAEVSGPADRSETRIGPLLAESATGRRWLSRQRQKNARSDGIRA